MDILLLLGGKGRRMGSLTESLPKYLLEIDGASALARLLGEVASAFGSGRVVMATGAHGDLVERRFGNRYAGLDLAYSHDPRELETRRRISSAKGMLPGPFIVVGSDVLAHGGFLTQLATRYADSLREGALGIIGAASNHSPTSGHALVEIKNGLVTEYIHHPPPTWTDHFYRDMHTYCFDQRIFAFLDDAPDEIVWIERFIIWARAQGHTFAGEIYSDRWYHFGVPEDLKTNIVFSP